MLIQTLNHTGIVVQVADLALSNKKSVIHVLHVDDDSSLREISKLILLDLNNNFKIDQACSVDEGFSKLANGHYDVIVSDYEMPQKDGLQFLKELREQNNEIPFILFTGKGREEVAIKALNLGAEGYHNKGGSPETVYGELSHSIKLTVDRRKAKLALSESERRYRALMEKASDAIFVHDLKGRIIDANQRACNSLGYSKEELLEMAIGDIDRETVQNGKGDLMWSKVIAGEAFVFEANQKRKDGSVFPVEVSLGPIIVDNETLVMGLVRDITERKQVEKELLESETKFKLYIEHSPTAVFIANPQGKYEYVNDAASGLLGYSKEELLEMSIPQISFKEDPTVYLKKFEEVKVTGRSLSVTALKTKKGSPVYVILNSIKLPDGKLMAFCENVTEQEEEKEKLVFLNRRYELAQRAAKAGVWDWNVKTGEIKWTPKMFELFGLDPQKHKASFAAWESALYIEDREKARNNINFALTNHVFLDNEYRIVMPKGGIRWINALGEGEYDETGNPLSMSGICIDVTDRKKAEESLKTSEQQFRHLFSHMPSGVAVYEAVDDGKDFVFRDFNTAAERIEKITREKVIGKRVTEVFPGVENFGLFNVFKQVWQTGESEYYPSAIYKDDKDPGTWRENWVYKLPNGNIVAIYNDITERTKAEVALQESQQKFKALFAANPDAVIFADTDFRILEANYRFSTLFGYSFDEVKGKVVTDLIVPDDSIEESRVGRKKILSGSAELVTTRKRKDGSLIPLFMSGGPVLVNGKVIGSVMVYKDLSDVITVQEELSKTLDRAELLNEKLRVVGSLTRHDVGNKLMAAKANVYLLKKRMGDNPDLVKYLDGIDSALVSSDRIFEFSQLYERIGVEKPSAENVFECFNRAVSLISNLDTIKILNQCQGLVVMADSLLNQLFYSFIDNSVKHGERVSQIRLYYSKEGDGVKLFYEDDGVGVYEVNKPKLFDSGFTTGKGSGLGLYLVKKMMDVYGWGITEEGQEGKGAKFVISIPLHSVRD